MGLESDLTSLLHEMRERRGLSRVELGKRMQERISKHNITPYGIQYYTDVIRQYETIMPENHLFCCLDEATDNIEPQRSLFCLYVEVLELSQPEKNELRQLVEEVVDNNFNFEVNYDAIRRRREKKGDILKKYKALPPAARYVVDIVIETLSPRK